MLLPVYTEQHVAGFSSRVRLCHAVTYRNNKGFPGYPDSNKSACLKEKSIELHI